MCDTYVPEMGYICNTCKAEFKDYMQAKGVVDRTHKEIMEELDKFLSTEAGKSLDKIDIDNFFKEYES